MAPKIREGEEEGAIGDDRCEEWAIRRGAVVLHPVPTRSAAGGAPGTQRRLGEVSWRVTPIQAHPAAAGAYLDRELLQYIECVDWTLDFL